MATADTTRDAHAPTVRIGRAVYTMRLLKGSMYVNGARRDAIIDHDERMITVADCGCPEQLMWNVAAAVVRAAKRPRARRGRKD